NPFDEARWVSCLRENLTSSSYGEGLETGRAVTQVPRQSLTRQFKGNDDRASGKKVYVQLKSGAPICGHAKATDAKSLT
ncbi:MAG: hypothetical protein M3461_21155, partial [Pseudomonadota bacterium]|nr:hypothetical protein [Pseudomonadota bacterium]